MINFWRLKTRNPFFSHYAYIDAKEHLANNLFEKHNVNVRVRAEFQEKDALYRIISCKVRKGKEDAFEDAMRELPDKAAIMGYLDYIEYCVDLMARIEKLRNAE